VRDEVKLSKGVCLRRTKGSYYSALYARIARRRGPNKAVVAVANSMLETAWHLRSTGALYQDPGADYFERRHDPAIEAKRLQRRIEALGFAVTIEEKAAGGCRGRPPFV
jgi:transposase